MKKGVLVLLFMIIFSIWSTAQDNLIPWQYSPVKIDGLSDEWIDNLRYFNEETQFHYGITNDENNLYLCFFTASQMRQMKLFRAGMKIELKTKGKQKHTAAIFYPKKDTTRFQMRGRPADGEPQGERPQNIDRSEMERNITKRFLENNPTFFSDGFVNFNGTYPVQNENGINLAINWDEKRRMTYEIAIPLKELFGENYDLNSIAKSDIKLKVVIDALEMTSSTGQRPAGGPYGGNMNRSSGQNQNSAGQAQEDRTFLFQEQTFTYDFKLSIKQ